MGKLTITKAKKIMKHGEVRGHPLSSKQKGLFGLIAGGGKPTRLKTNRKRQLAILKRRSYEA